MEFPTSNTNLSVLLIVGDGQESSNLSNALADYEVTELPLGAHTLEQVYYLSIGTYDLAVIEAAAAHLAVGLAIGQYLSVQADLPLVFVGSPGASKAMRQIAALPRSTYVVRPIYPSQLTASIELVTARTPPSAASPTRRATSYAERLREDRFFIKGDNKYYHCVQFDTLAYLESDRNTTYCTALSGEKQLIPLSLTAVLQQVGRDDLIQVHRKYAVAYHAIEQISADEIILKGGRQLPVGRSYQKDLHRMLKKIRIS